MSIPRRAFKVIADHVDNLPDYIPAPVVRCVRPGDEAGAEAVWPEIGLVIRFTEHGLLQPAAVNYRDALEAHYRPPPVEAVVWLQIREAQDLRTPGAGDVIASRKPIASGVKFKLTEVRE